MGEHFTGHKQGVVVGARPIKLRLPGPEIPFLNGWFELIFAVDVEADPVLMQHPAVGLQPSLNGC